MSLEIGRACTLYAIVVLLGLDQPNFLFFYVFHCLLLIAGIFHTEYKNLPFKQIIVISITRCNVRDKNGVCARGVCHAGSVHLDSVEIYATCLAELTLTSILFSRSVTYIREFVVWFGGVPKDETSYESIM